MKFIYLVHCTYRAVDSHQRGQFANLAFKTQQEAIDYCTLYTTESEFWTWTPVQLGSFSITSKKKTK